ELTQQFMGAFVHETRGYRLKQMILQTPVVQEMQAILRTGVVLIRNENTGKEPSWTELEEIARKPHLMYLSKELALAQPGGWGTSLFTYIEPMIGFSRSEQRLLEEAIRGVTDEELACELGVSFAAVKKTWRLI